MSPVAAAKPAASAFPLPLPLLHHDPDIRAQAPCDLNRAVRGTAVDDDHLVQPVRQSGKHVRQVLGLVQRGDDHAHPDRPNRNRGFHATGDATTGRATQKGVAARTLEDGCVCGYEASLRRCASGSPSSFFSVLFSIWRIRSRVTPNARPTSSSVRAFWPFSP